MDKEEITTIGSYVMLGMEKKGENENKKQQVVDCI